MLNLKCQTCRHLNARYKKRNRTTTTHNDCYLQWYCYIYRDEDVYDPERKNCMLYIPIKQEI